MQTIIDVRSAAEYNSGHAKNAINIPVDQLAIQLNKDFKLEKDTEIILYCASGGRAGVAKTILERAGYQKVTNVGGLSNMR